MLSFVSDANSLVKEASLQLIIKLLETFPSGELTNILDPQNLLIKMLDEIKLRRPSASVRGALWHLVGLLHDKYGLDNLREESQDVMFIQLDE
jgi:hypothetical protein